MPTKKKPPAAKPAAAKVPKVIEPPPPPPPAAAEPPRRWVYLTAETLPSVPGQPFPAHHFVIHLDPEKTVLQVTKDARGEVVDTQVAPDPRYCLEWHWSESETMDRARIIAELEAIADHEAARLLPGTPIEVGGQPLAGG